MINKIEYMFKKTIFLGITTLFFAALLVVPSQVSALGLTPAIMEVDLTAGEKTVAVVELKNDTQEEIKLETEVINFTAEGETGQPAFDFEAAQTGIATWVDVDEGPITIKVGATQEVTVTFDTPANATAGGHYVAVFFNETLPDQQDGQLLIESKLGTLFMATVAGDYTEAGSIATFTSDKTNYSDGAVKFAVRFKNTGEAHIKPAGTVVITDMFGKDVESIAVNSEKGAILAGSVREFAVANWDVTGFGKFTATLTMTDGTVTDTEAIEFWVMTTTGIVIVIVIILVLILLIALIIKMSKKSSKNETPQQE
ncbi:MAG: hypothetical protein ACNFW9_04035 [Candidatus Kerfeldbacteria bacterium]